MTIPETIPQTIPEILALATRCSSSSDVSLTDVRALGHKVTSLFETPLECGWPEPEVVRYRPGHVAVAWEALGGSELTPDESIAVGMMLVRKGIEAQSSETSGFLGEEKKEI